MNADALTLALAGRTFTCAAGVHEMCPTSGGAACACDCHKPEEAS